MDFLQVIYNTPVARRPPNWRWSLAHHCTIRRGRRHVTRTEDSVVFDAIQYRKLMEQNPIKAQARYRALAEAESLYNNNAAQSTKWAVEAWLCAKATDKEIAETFYLEHGEETTYYYRKLFFDIEYYQDSDVVMYINVLNREKAVSDVGEDHRYIWKMIGYKHGVEGLSELFSFFIGEPLTNKLKKWMNDITKERMGYNTFIAAQDFRNLQTHSAQFAIDSASRNGSIKAEDDEDEVEENEMLGLIKDTVNSLSTIATDPSLPAIARSREVEFEGFSGRDYSQVTSDIDELFGQAMGQ